MIKFNNFHPLYAVKAEKTLNYIFINSLAEDPGEEAISSYH